MAQATWFPAGMSQVLHRRRCSRARAELVLDDEWDPRTVRDGRIDPLAEGRLDLLVGRRSVGRRSGLAQRAARGMIAALVQARPNLTIDQEGRVGSLTDLLVPTARLAADQRDILPERSRVAVDDTLALTANCFLPWSRRPTALELGQMTGFTGLRFAARCPTGIRGTPPQTDLLLIGQDMVAGVVAKVTEHLTSPKTKLAEGYDQPMPEPGLMAWHRLLVDLRQAPQLFRLLDAVALAKHAIGLARNFPGQQTTLVYLFWEPTDARSHPVFAAHRAEIALLRQRVAASGVPVVAIGVRELWDGWLARGRSRALNEHVAALEARYGVAIGA